METKHSRSGRATMFLLSLKKIQKISKNIFELFENSVQLKDSIKGGIIHGIND